MSYQINYLYNTYIHTERNNKKHVCVKFRFHLYKKVKQVTTVEVIFLAWFNFTIGSRIVNFKLLHLIQLLHGKHYEYI